MELPDGRIPIVLSAHADDLLAQDAAAIADYLACRPRSTDVSAVAATLLRTRRLRRHRAAVRAADRAELLDGLHALAAGEEHPLVTRAAAGPRGRIAFAFPGQGSQWPSMGVEAYHRLPEYRAEADDCAAEFAAQGLPSPLDYLLADASARTNDYSQLQIQGAQFVHGVALARVWRSCGVPPDITVGHSLGEIGAAHVAGALTLPLAVGVVAARATLLDTLTGPYRVGVLGVSPDEAQDVIAATPGWLELSVVNSPTSVAVSGEADAVAAAVRAVADRGVFAREIEMWFPAHTSALDALRGDLDALLPAGEFSDTPVQFIGSATAAVVPAGTDFAGYWYHNLRTTVRFDRAVTAALECGATTFIELSAHPALLFAMADVLDASRDPSAGLARVVGSGRRDEPLTDRLSANVLAVALADSGYRWAADDKAPLLHDFPFAPMRAEHHWARPEPLPPVTGLTVGTEHWEPIAVPPVTASRTVAVLDLGGGPLAGHLRSALDGRGHLVAVEQADLLIAVAPAIDDHDPVAAGHRLADAVDAGLLRYADAVTEQTRDVWLVTVGADRVGHRDKMFRPGQAALAAMHRSVGFEHPDHAFRHLDVSTREPDAALAAAAAAVLAGAAHDVALRSGAGGPTAYRRALRDEQVLAPAWPASTLDEVVITGGTGAVGLHVARALVARGARRIVLLSRRGVDAGVVAWLAAGRDVEIVSARCDLTDGMALAAAAAEFGGSGASLVVHAAGAATIAPAAQLTGAVVRDAIAAKVVGLDALAAAWPLRADAPLVLCSSVSGLWGGSGHAAYAAANRLLDASADRLRGTGRRCASVRWGLWPGTGIIDAIEVARVELSGLRAMAPERAVDAMLRDYAADPLVFSADAERLTVFLGTATAPQANTTEEHCSDTAVDAYGAVHTALGAVLKLHDTTGLDLDAPLLDLGVDSLLAIDLRKKLKSATGENIPLAIILGGATATELIGRLQTPKLGNPA